MGPLNPSLPMWGKTQKTKNGWGRGGDKMTDNQVCPCPGDRSQPQHLPQTENTRGQAPETSA